MKHNIFISYRRDDVASTVYRLADALKARYGAKRIIVDTDIPRGIKSWWGHLERAMKTCGACLIVIGPRWLYSGQGEGPKIRDDEDVVRREIKLALQSVSDVWPLLVDGARMPPADELPEDIRAITVPQAIPLDSGYRWPNDLEEIYKLIGPPPQRLRRALALAMGLAVCAAVAVGAVIHQRRNAGPPASATSSPAPGVKAPAPASSISPPDAATSNAPAPASGTETPAPASRARGNTTKPAAKKNEKRKDAERAEAACSRGWEDCRQDCHWDWVRCNCPPTNGVSKEEEAEGEACKKRCYSDKDRCFDRCSRSLDRCRERAP